MHALRVASGALKRPLRRLWLHSRALHTLNSRHASKLKSQTTSPNLLSALPIQWNGSFVPKRYAWFQNKVNEQPVTEEVPDESLLPPGAEGVPFRLAPGDAMEAYARWSWQESPWFTPIQPERLRPIYAPFWIFEFTLTVTDTETGSVTKVPYRNLYGNSNMQYYRRKAAQIYAGQRFNRLLVDVLKAPATLAQRWNGREMLTLPKERAYGVFTQYEEYEDDEDVMDEGRKRKPSVVKTKHHEKKDDEKYMKLFPNPDFTVKNPPPPRPIELDAFALSEAIAWGRVQEAVISTELAILHHHYVHGTTVDRDYGKVTQQGVKSPSHNPISGLFSFFTKTPKETSQVTQPSEPTTQGETNPNTPYASSSEPRKSDDLDLDLDDLRAAFMFRAHGTLNSASSGPQDAAIAAEAIQGKGFSVFSRTSAKSVQNIKDRYTFSFEEIHSRRVYLPGYVTEYKSLMKYWRVFTSGVTGETFGLQQLGPLGFINFTKQLKFHPWMMVLVNDLNLKIGGIILRKLLMTPAAAAISTAVGAAVMLARKLSAHRQESEIERKWNQIREDEAKMDAFLSSGRDLWMFRRPANEMDKRESLHAKRLWAFITREDVAHRERLKRQEERKRKQELEKLRLENLAKPPPKIPEDPYELLGLALPATQTAANAYTQHDISQAFRRQLMTYHPDTYNEETAHWSKAYAHKRTQALIEAYGAIKTPELRKAYNVRYPQH